MEDIEMPVVATVSPDIVDGPHAGNPQPGPPYTISEAQCERAVFIWELHENTFPLPVIPAKVIVNPLEPERDSSLSIIDLMDSVPSGRFIRGQEVNRPAEWQLYLQKNPKDETEYQITLTCEKIYLQASVHILAKVSCEIIDDGGVVIWSNGDVYDSEVKPFSQGTTHAISFGKKSDLQENREEYVKNGVLRFRLRLNIYTDLTDKTVAQSNEHDRSSAKRRRLESGLEPGLVDLLSSLNSLWENRQQSGDITILCGEEEIKAHRFILSGRSKVFMEMLESSMETTEKSTRIIKVEEISPEIFTSMLEFLYLNVTSQFDWTNIDHICALIYAADKYWITPLTTRCYQSLMKLMNLENFAKIVKVTFMYNCGKQFKDQVRHFFESNQITLNSVESFRQFAYDDFEYFWRLFFYTP